MAKTDSCRNTQYLQKFVNFIGFMIMWLFYFSFLGNYFGLFIFDISRFTFWFLRLPSYRQDYHYQRAHHCDEVIVTVGREKHCVLLRWVVEPCAWPGRLYTTIQAPYYFQGHFWLTLKYLELLYQMTQPKPEHFLPLRELVYPIKTLDSS